MFIVNSDQSVYLTRGDVAVFEISAENSDGVDYIYKKGDVVRLQIMEKGRCDQVLLQKSIVADEETNIVCIILDKDDTKLGETIHKPKDYWYEVELNPDTVPQTLVGYDTTGPKIFRLFPEGEDHEYNT